MPRTTTNQGELVNPPVSIADMALPRGEKWALLIPLPADCDAACEEVLYFARQVHKALGKDSDRIQRLLLADAAMSDALSTLLAAEHPNAIVVPYDPAVRAALAAISGSTGVLQVFVADPLGNVMMFYQAGDVGKPMQKDLKHLLKISKIG